MATAGRQTASDDEESIQKQLADARVEAQNALAEFRRYSTPYYDRSWAEAVEKVKRLEDKIRKREANTLSSDAAASRNEN